MSTVATDSKPAESYEDIQSRLKVGRRIKRYARPVQNFILERKKVSCETTKAGQATRRMGQPAEYWSEILKEQTVLLRRNVTSLMVGTAQYELRKPAAIQFSFAGGLYSATIDHLTDGRFLGRSEDKTTAERKLLEAIHAEFQRLYKTQPMQRSAEDDCIWQQLDSLIDASAYRRQQKVVHQVLGCIRSIEPRSMKLEEVGGAEWHLPTESLAGAEWSHVAVGDWIECAVVKVINSREIFSAAFLAKAKPPRVPSDEEIEQFYARLPSADFPNAE